MKNFKYYFLSLSVFALLIACEDDEPATAGEGDPLSKNVINLESTVATTTTLSGEGDIIPFSVTIPETFESDATVTAEVRLDNGRTTLGSATIPAGATSGTGTIGIPGDDGASSGNLYGLPDSATIKIIGIQLDTLVPDAFYTISSNEVKFGILDRTLGVAGGLNILFDWAGAPAADLDMYVYDANTFEQFESAATGSRYEVDLFENAGRPDGDYFVAIQVYANGSVEPTADIDYLFALTLPDGTVDIYTGTFEDAAADDFYYPVINFTKTTDPETGTVSYTTSAAN